MKKAQVKIGQTYLCKVGRSLTAVRIDSESRHGGWDATNVKTRRKVRIKSAQRLRATARREAPGAEPATKATKATPKRDTAQRVAPQAQEPAKAKKPSLMNEAAAVLKESGQHMNAKAMVEAVLAKGLWATKGKTPAATLYASILREIQKKGDQARFVKTERGKFALKS